MDPNQFQAKLPDDTAKGFVLAPGAPVEFFNPKLGKNIKTAAITPALAQRLVDAGSAHISAIAAASATAQAAIPAAGAGTEDASKLKV